MCEILLVDDHEIVRDGLAFYFEDQTDFKVAFQASNGKEAFDILNTRSVDIVVTDIMMPMMDGLELLRQIRKNLPHQRVMVLTMLGEARHIKEMIALGVEGYLLKNCTRSEILNALTLIMAGENYFAQEVTRSIINDLAGKRNPRQRLVTEIPLSRREKEILKLILEEHSNQEIADRLFISQRTVETHKHNLLEKTGAKNIVGLVLYAMDHDLV